MSREFLKRLEIVEKRGVHIDAEFLPDLREELEFLYMANDFLTYQALFLEKKLAKEIEEFENYRENW